MAWRLNRCRAQCGRVAVPVTESRRRQPQGEVQVLSYHSRLGEACFDQRPLLKMQTLNVRH